MVHPVSLSFLSKSISQVNIDSNSGILIAMNPAGKGYGERQKLPDNLKQLFRPVAMSKPDNDLIAGVLSVVWCVNALLVQLSVPSILFFTSWVSTRYSVLLLFVRNGSAFIYSNSVQIK